MGVYKPCFYFRALCAVLVFLFFCEIKVQAQCTTSISAFPFTEDFENSDGSWISGSDGGTYNGWAWGSVNKPVIKNKLGSTKCWSVDGLTTSGYANDEQSWVKSPCYDFTNLVNPYITVDIFYETEFSYDGANLQYSMDGGNSWSLAGRPSQSPCLDAYLYTGNVLKLSSFGIGWSGSKSSNGCGTANTAPGTWVTTKMYLPQLAGKQNIRFRFYFGAGRICNGFDGFAFDNFTVQEVPPTTADFTYACAGANTINFTSIASCTKSQAWDFGDLLSGASNTSTLQNPSHTFSTTGLFTVTLSSTDQQNVTTITNKQVSVISISDGGTINVSCNGLSDGSATVIVNGIPDNYNFLWNTSPQQTTATALNLAKGQYTVTVSSAQSCTVTKDFIIDEPQAIDISFNMQPSTCGNSNASVDATITGGVVPYNLSWSPVEGNTTSLSNIDSGKYTLTVTDNNNCIFSKDIQVTDISDLKISLGPDTTICTGDVFSISPGSGFSSYLWQDGSANSSYMILKEGLYFVKVKNADGCSASDSVNIVADCGQIFFPTGFTPNGDNRNDFFGPVGNLAALANYSFIIYDRWGHIVFSSTNPFAKWDGFSATRQKNNATTYVWYARYDYKSEKGITQKGTITVFY